MNKYFISQQFPLTSSICSHVYGWTDFPPRQRYVLVLINLNAGTGIAPTRNRFSLPKSWHDKARPSWQRKTRQFVSCAQANVIKSTKEELVKENWVVCPCMASFTIYIANFSSTRGSYSIDHVLAGLSDGYCDTSCVTNDVHNLFRSLMRSWQNYYVYMGRKSKVKFQGYGHAAMQRVAGRAIILKICVNPIKCTGLAV